MKLFNKPTVNNKQILHSDRATKRKQKKQTLDNLTRIYSILAKTAKMWGKTDLPINTVKQTIEKAKIKPQLTHVSKEDTEISKYANGWNKMLNSIYNTIEEQAKEMKTKDVPLSFLNYVIAQVKVELKK